MRIRLLPLALLPALLLAGCSGAPSSSAADDGRVRVVASTDVWGDVVQQIGGDAVSVDSLITDPDRDPHEYQADPRDQLAVSRAQIVVVNGGGYDDFLERLTANAPSSARVLDLVQESGVAAPAGGELNEHLWYDLDAVSTVSGDIAAELTRVAPQHRADFAAGLRTFRAGLSRLQREEAAIRDGGAAGEGVAITEPVPLHMTAALGLVDRTPAAFSSAVEEGGDVAPAVLREQLLLFSQHRVVLLAVNEQTAGATTDQVVAAAKAAGVPVVGVRETLPDGQDYLTWMAADLAAMRAALIR